MSPRVRNTPDLDPRWFTPSALLLAVFAAAGSLAAYLGAAIPAAIPAQGAATRDPTGNERFLEADSGAQAALEEARPPSARAVCSPGADAPPAGSAWLSAEPAAKFRARAAMESLSDALEPVAFHMASFEIQARALAATLSAESARELSLLAADEDQTAASRVAIAEILRHVPATSETALPPSALATLRAAWQGRAGDPILAAAAVKALGAFGDAEDRRGMLDAVTPQAPASAAALACAGLSAARGDEAALEIADAAAEMRDERRSEVALSALTALAGAKDRGLSEGVRVQCAETIVRALRRQAAQGPSSRLEPALHTDPPGAEPNHPRAGRRARLLAALTVLDPGRAQAPLLASLADDLASHAEAQSAASALSAMPAAAPELGRMLADLRLGDHPRTLAAEALLRGGCDPFGEARSALERKRDAAQDTPLGLRAARIVEHAGAMQLDRER